MFEPIKVGFGEYMTRFYASIVPTTKALNEYAARGFGVSVVLAPTRMIDTVTEQLEMWQRNDTDNSPTRPHKLPVIIIAFANDYMPTGRDYTRQIGESVKVILPNDPKERVFGLRSIAGDIAVQVAIFAQDEPTAKSLAAQFILHLDSVGNHGFTADFPFAGLNTVWGVQIESPETPASAVESEAKNVKILAIRLNLKCQVPLFDHPKDNEPNDGKGTDGDINDPHGYPVNNSLSYTQVPYDATKVIV